MPDLQNLPGRRTAQDRITQNRDTILPRSRNTDAPSLTVRGDLRTAARGDDSDQVRQILGMVGSTVQTAYNAKTAHDAQPGGVYDQQAAQGKLDAATGKDADPAQRKAIAYQEAFYGVRAEAETNTFAQAQQQLADDMVTQGHTPQEIDEAIHANFADFIGKTMDSNPSASARADTGKRLSSFAAKLHGEIIGKIKDRTDKEVLDTEATNVAARVTTGQPIDLEGTVGRLKAIGVDPKVGVAHVIDAVTAAAREHNDSKPLHELLTSMKADGKTPSLNPEQRNQVLDKIESVEGDALRAAKAKRQADQLEFEQKWFEDGYAGKDVTEEIKAKVADRTFTPSEGLALESAHKALRDRLEEGDQDERAVIDMQLRILDPKNDPYKLKAEAADAYNHRLYGTGSAAARGFKEILAAAQSRITSLDNKAIAASNRATAQAISADRKINGEQTRVAISYLDQSLAPRTNPITHFAPTDQQIRDFRDTKLTFFRRVNAGEDANAVADDLIKKAGKGPAAGPPIRVFDGAHLKK